MEDIMKRQSFFMFFFICATNFIEAEIIKVRFENNTGAEITLMYGENELILHPFTPATYDFNNAEQKIRFSFHNAKTKNSETLIYEGMPGNNAEISLFFNKRCELDAVHNNWQAFRLKYRHKATIMAQNNEIQQN